MSIQCSLQLERCFIKAQKPLLSLSWTQGYRHSLFAENIVRLLGELYCCVCIIHHSDSAFDFTAFEGTVGLIVKIEKTAHQQFAMIKSLNCYNLLMARHSLKIFREIVSSIEHKAIGNKAISFPTLPMADKGQGYQSSSNPFSSGSVFTPVNVSSSCPTAACDCPFTSHFTAECVLCGTQGSVLVCHGCVSICKECPCDDDDLISYRRGR